MMLQSSNEWLPGILMHLLVPCLVWATLIAGLISIVRDNMEQEDVAKYLCRHSENGWEAERAEEDLDGNIKLNSNDERPGSQAGKRSGC